MQLDVVILAAGLGSRLKNFTLEKPKAMVQVGHQTLIDHALSFLDLSKVQKVFVVGGYQAEVLKNHLSSYKEQVEFVYNPDYQQGSVITLEKALPFIKGNFLLMNVDHIYPKKMFLALLNQVHENGIFAMADLDRNLVADDMKIDFKKPAVIGKISKQLTQYSAGYIGMSFIGKEKLAFYKEAVQVVKEQTQGMANVEGILDYLAPQEDISVIDLSGFGWHEVDTPEDKTLAEKTFEA